MQRREVCVEARRGHTLAAAHVTASPHTVRSRWESPAVSQTEQDLQETWFSLLWLRTDEQIDECASNEGMSTHIPFNKPFGISYLELKTFPPTTFTPYM